MHLMNIGPELRHGPKSALADSHRIHDEGRSVAPTTAMVPGQMRTSNFMAVTAGKMRAPKRAKLEHSTHLCVLVHSRKIIKIECEKDSASNVMVFKVQCVRAFLSVAYLCIM